VIPGTGQRFSTNMISAVTNRGHLCFMVFGEKFRVKVFLDFQRVGVTVMVATHDYDLVHRMGHREIRLREGKLVPVAPAAGASP